MGNINKSDQGVQRGYLGVGVRVGGSLDQV